MEIKITIPEYSGNGISYEWEPGFEIEAKIDDGEILILANKAGLISLARHLLTLAQDEVPINNHLHLDEFNALEDGSSEIIIQKK